MKLDAKGLRYLSRDEFRILTAAEMGSKNHEVVPYGLIASIAGLKHGMAVRSLDDLQRYRLLKREQGVKYDGYRLTYGGYDYLALKTLVTRGTLRSIGQQIGIGKESDVYVVSGIDISDLEQAVASSATVTSNLHSRYERLQEKKAHEQAAKDAAPEIFFALKIHRLGRTSFRNVKNTRDYLISRKHSSWMYLSRLAAMKEFAFMQALYTAGFPVPRPIDFNRHCVVMELLRNSIPLNHLHEEDFGNDWLVAIEQLFDEIMALIVKFALHGLIHGDFNEFNLMIEFDEELSERAVETGVFVNTNQRTRPENTRFGKPIVIDFPQMVSTRHENAQELFERDVSCIQRFFKKRFKYESERAPQWSEDVRDSVEEKEKRLDEDVQASGYNGKNRQEGDDIWSIYLTCRKREEEGDDDDEEEKVRTRQDDVVQEPKTDDQELKNIAGESEDELGILNSGDEQENFEEFASDSDLDESVKGVSAIIGQFSLEDDQDGVEKECEKSEAANVEIAESCERSPKCAPRISAAEIQRRVKRALKKEEEKKARRQKEKNKTKTKEQRQNTAAVTQNWTGW